MERIFLRLVATCAVALLQTPTATAMDYRTEESVRSATFEFLAPSADSGRESLVGTAFAIGPNQFVTAAHLVDASIGSHFEHPQLVDSHHNTYRIADLLQYSEQQDYAVFTLEHPPTNVKPLPVRRDYAPARDLYFSGWRGDGKVIIERGTYSGLTRDEESREFDWLRFSGKLWNSLGGGPLLDGSGQAIGIVQARARDSSANYAVPIYVLPTDGLPSAAQIRGMDLLRSLMPVVSAVEPLKGEIPLPLSFDEFSQQLQQLRREYFDRTVSPLLEATRGTFVLTGAGAAQTCSLLNGKACQCKGRTGLSGSLVLDNPCADEMLVTFEKGQEVTQVVAGVTLVRTRAAAADGDLYTDFHDRAWYMRTSPLEHQDRVVISLARKLPEGYVVLTRTAPTAVSTAAIMQVKFVANLIYYGCEELPAEGIARVASLTPVVPSIQF